MKAELHPYQQRAVEFLKEHTHAALFLDCGLGKSLITLTALSDLIDTAEAEKVLVIAPKTVAENTWSDECAKWDHLSHLRVSRVIGTQKQRIAALQKPADIYVLGRDSVVWLVQHYRARMPFDVIVLDELTSFKSSTSLRFKAIRLIRSQPNRIIGLTGTPAPNGYPDLWGQIFCLDGGERLGKYKTHYIRYYFNTVTVQQGYMLKCTLRPGAQEQIQQRISDICLSMRSEDYLQLPPRRDIVYHIELPKTVKRKYDEFEREQVLSLPSDNVTAASAAALLNKLSQFANGAVYNEEHLALDIHDNKLNALSDIVESAGSPVLVFYQYRSDIPRIQHALKGIVSHIRVYEGEQDFRDWNAGHIDVLLAHPASCSFGLNLQKGGHIVVWFGTGWNLEWYQQANSRIYRQGQQHTVIVYNLVCRSTVDERALRAIQGKGKTQDMLMNAVKELQRKYK